MHIRRLLDMNMHTPMVLTLLHPVPMEFHPLRNLAQHNLCTLHQRQHKLPRRPQLSRIMLHIRDISHMQRHLSSQMEQCHHLPDTQPKDIRIQLVMFHLQQQQHLNPQ
jgi:hypothetical protein